MPNPISPQERYEYQRMRVNRTEDRAVLVYGGRFFAIQTEFNRSLRTLEWRWSWNVSEMVPNGTRSWTNQDGYESAESRSDAIRQATAFIMGHVIGDPDVGPDTYVEARVQEMAAEDPERPVDES